MRVRVIGSVVVAIEIPDPDLQNGVLKSISRMNILLVRPDTGPCDVKKGVLGCVLESQTVSMGGTL